MTVESEPHEEPGRDPLITSAYAKAAGAVVLGPGGIYAGIELMIDGKPLWGALAFVGGTLSSASLGRGAHLDAGVAAKGLPPMRSIEDLG